jgi:hypothetical protein
VHIESSCTDPLIRVFMADGCIWASGLCHTLDSKMVRDFPRYLVIATVRALRGELSVFLSLPARYLMISVRL